MDIADNGAFRQRLVMLAELFDVKLSAPRQALYFEALRYLPFEAVAHGLNSAAKSCTFMPKPAEIRTLAVGDDEDAAELAWLALRKAMHAAGGYSSLVTHDAALGETIVRLFGSWPEACAADLSPEMWANRRKEFGRIYRVMRNRQIDGARYLPGLCEATNAGRGDWQRFVPVAVLEGDGIRAMTGVEADQYRAQLAAQAHGFKQLPDALDALPVRHKESA